MKIRYYILVHKKNWKKKTAKKRKHDIRFYPILDDFQPVFWQKNNFDFFVENTLLYRPPIFQNTTKQKPGFS